MSRNYTEIAMLQAIRAAQDCLDTPNPSLADIRKAKKQLERAIELVRGDK